MDWTSSVQRSAFFDLHSDNPREGPGDFSSAKRAYRAACEALPATEPVTILDLACGPGMQTRYLAELSTNARITALDITPAYIANLNDWITEAELGHRVSAVQGDMSEPDWPPESIDLIWCEGAVYFLGVTQALTRWAPYLSTGGCVAFTEPVFLSDELPQTVIENWAEYPAMTDMAGVNRQIEAAGFAAREQFVLGSEAWAEYYEPLQRRVNLLREKYAGQPEAAGVIEEGQSEIDVWRDYGELFSYAFFVVQKP